MGDMVVGADLVDDQVRCVSTYNFNDIKLYADNFILASGGFFSKGLIATPDRVFEPIFNADVQYSLDREDWYDKDFFNKQEYLGFGVKYNSSLNAFINDVPIRNLYVCGSILSGANSIYEGSGAGVSIISAMAVADNVLSNK